MLFRVCESTGVRGILLGRLSELVVGDTLLRSFAMRFDRGRHKALASSFFGGNAGPEDGTTHTTWRSRVAQLKAFSLASRKTVLTVTWRARTDDTYRPSDC
jgi:hypothetical protein